MIRGPLAAAALFSAFAWPGWAFAAPAGSAAPPCTPSPDRPPDPRCGENLDGRGQHDGPGWSAPRALLLAPRLASRAFFWPIVRTTAAMEEHHVAGWLTTWLTTDDGKIGIRPELEYTSNFLPTVGARVFNHRWPGDGHRTLARFHTAGPAAWRGELAWAAPPELGLEARLFANRRRDWLFAGIGPLSNAELERRGLQEARYDANVLQAELGWAPSLGGPFGFELLTDVQRRRYRADRVSQGEPLGSLYGLPPEVCAELGFAPGCIDPAEVPGFNRGLRIAHLGAELSLARLPAGRYQSGAFLGARGNYGHGIDGDPSRHLRLEAEAVGILGGLDRTLRFRLWAAKVDPLGDAAVPFDELVAPAGDIGMRGFSRGRFRDRSGLSAALEYRWFISFNVDASLFADLGTVAGPNFSGLGEALLFPSFGVGLRIVSSERPYWMADPVRGIQVAYAQGGLRVLLSLAAL